MTKNDFVSIENWIIYHGYLFGLENLHLLDGSDDPRVLEIYDFYKARGLNVHHSATGLNGLAAELTALMHQYKGEDNFLIKLDSDEFLAHSNRVLLKEKRSVTSLWKWIGRAIKRDSPKCRAMNVSDFNFYAPPIEELSVNEFRRFIEGLPKTDCTYKAGLVAYSNFSMKAVEDPQREVVDFCRLYPTDFKSFFHSSGFVSVDLGSHAGESLDSSRVLFTGLAIIHYHFVDIRDFVDRARKVIVSHGYINGSDSLDVQMGKLEELLEKSKATMPSSHKAEFYLNYLKQKDEAGIKRLAADFAEKSGARSFRSEKSTLVRDTIERIEQDSSFPVRRGALS